MYEPPMTPALTRFSITSMPTPGPTYQRSSVAALVEALREFR
jgi:hypothetical protein